MHLLDSMDEDAKRRDWRTQRVVWAAIAIVVLAAGVGLLGDGPLAHGHAATEQDGARYEASWERINRRDHVTLMSVRVDAPAAAGDELKVAFSNGFLASLHIRSSTPGADGAEVGPEGGAYTFKVEDWSAPVEVWFEYLPEKLGRSSGTVTIQAGGSDPVTLRVSHFIHP